MTTSVGCMSILHACNVQFACVHPSGFVRDINCAFIRYIDFKIILHSCSL